MKKMSKSVKKHNYVIGISCHFHDSAVCLLRDGMVVSASSEERLSRKKQDSAFPSRALKYCLHSEGITPNELNKIVFYENPFEKARRIIRSIEHSNSRGTNVLTQPLSSYISDKLDVKSIITDQVYQIYGEKIDRDLVEYGEHHASHAASTYYTSPYEQAAVLCIDGVGEFDTTTAWNASHSELTKVNSMQYPHSLGLFYAAMTNYLGFRSNSDEYKVMGLASFGKPKFKDKLREAVFCPNGTGFELKLQEQFEPIAHLHHEYMNAISTILGESVRDTNTLISQFHCDVAASAQSILENEMIQLSFDTHELVQKESICLAGGVALNCAAVSKIRDHGPFKNVWVQPASNDAGASLGAALQWFYKNQKRKRKIRTFDPYLGYEISDQVALAAIESEGLCSEFLSDFDLINRIANCLAKGKTVALCRGRMEFGPRALGNRSILADPRNLSMKDHVNSVIKNREEFRPFAPVVPVEKFEKWFSPHVASPYMTFTYSANPTKNSVSLNAFGRSFRLKTPFPAATHVDNTCRLQTVDKQMNSLLHGILNEFEAITGLPVILNTSFNGNDEPIVCTEIDAVRCYLQNQIDILCIGNHFVERDPEPKGKI